jgi:hypothetical protein
MKLLIHGKTWSCSLLLAVLVIFMLPTQARAFSLRDARTVMRNHRFIALALVSAGILYGYSHKTIHAMIKEYKNRDKSQNDPQAADLIPAKKIDYFEALADIFVKSTKVIGTIFKVLRAITCPSEGKLINDQWLDDFSQLA